MNIKDVKDLLQVIKDFDLTKFEIAEDNFKLSIERGQAHVSHIAGTASTMPMVLQQSPAMAHSVGNPTTAVAANAAQPAAEPNCVVIKSPMVGTFYRSASPERPVFVDKKSKVVNDSVVCIIEAMKVMNEVLAEVKGTIEEVLVENGKSVEFGQPLFKVKLD